jgi:phage gp29-like protein
MQSEMTGLLDHRGNPIRKDVLTREVAGPVLAGVRSPVAGYPADGMNPVRLASILRGADQGEPLSYFELAEQIEERDLHYVGTLGTRKRAVAQISASVVAASDAAADVAMADVVRDWLDRDELADETFDILDAVGKGVSFTEIIWDTSEGQWRPTRLEWRDPRWFTFDRKDGRTPLLRGGEEGVGAPAPLEPFKFITHQVRAKSGLPIRSGIARIAAWAWMFKAFTQRDWAIFTQTYGQPVRIGKFAPGASDSDRATLYRAVANIAGDCAAIIPQGMEIEFVESGNVAAGSELYEKRADWLDRQVSKAVLGQTNTTDAQAGGLGSAQASVHNDVRRDIETSDAKGLAATLNRDLVRPWIDLEYGPQKKYPRIVIEKPEAEDLKALADTLERLVSMGLEVDQGQVRDKFGWAEPTAGARLLGPRTPAAPPPPPPAPPTPALQSQQAPHAEPADLIGDQLVDDTAADVDGWFDELRSMMSAARSLPELGEMVRSAYPQLDSSAIAAKIAGGLTAAHAAGRSDQDDESA